MIETVARIDFGAGGNAASAIVAGFSHPEMGFTWSEGRKAILSIAWGAAQPPTMIEVDATPCLLGDERPYQTLSIRVGDVPIAEEVIRSDGAVAYWLPEGLDLGTACVIEFGLPDAVIPKEVGHGNEGREVAFMFKSVRLLHVPREPSIPARRRGPAWDLPASTGLTPECEAEVARRSGLSVRDLMFEFESLGWNCEFGIFQRRCGAEPLSFLRFAGILLPFLHKGLATDFVAVDDPRHVRLVNVGGEYLFRCEFYDIAFHTSRWEGKDDPDKAMQDTLRTMKFYRRRFREDMETPRRLYVMQRGGQLLPAHALALLTAIRTVGDASLLFVCEQADQPSGAVEQLGPHLYRGYMRKFAPGHDLVTCDLPSWLSICLNAWELWQGGNRDEAAATGHHATGQTSDALTTAG